MKKLVALMMILALVFSASCIQALAEGNEAESKGAAWSVIELKGTPAELNTYGNDPQFRHQTFSGPGRNYSLAGAYIPRTVTVSALLRENGYVLLDVEYNGGRRCIYLPERHVSFSGAEEVKPAAVSARTTASICPMYYGPGIQYDVVRQRTRSKYADLPMSVLIDLFDGDTEKIQKALKDVYPQVELPAGSAVSVLYEVNGWVCCEFDNTVLGLARTWIPADQVKAE